MIQLNHNYSLPERENQLFPIKVVGVGGAGINALDRIVLDGMDKGDLIAFNTDVQSLASSVAAAKVQIGKSAKFVGQQSIQLHGGIGMTMEYKVGHYFKRVTMIDTMFGDADHHLGVLARMGGIIGAK